MKIDRPYEQLPVWKNLMEFVKMIYMVTSTFPPDEKEGLTRKLRSSVTDIPVFIASGVSSRISIDSKPFLQQASSALMQTETLLLISMHLSIIQASEFESFQNQILVLNDELQQLIIRIDRKFN